MKSLFFQEVFFFFFLLEQQQVKFIFFKPISVLFIHFLPTTSKLSCLIFKPVVPVLNVGTCMLLITMQPSVMSDYSHVYNPLFFFRFFYEIFLLLLWNPQQNAVGRASSQTCDRAATQECDGSVQHRKGSPVSLLLPSP